MIKTLIRVVKDENRVKDVLKPCLPEGVSDEDCIEVMEHVVGTYMHMRSKDFVRKLMGRTAKTPTVGHRQEIAVLSNKKLRGKGEKKEDSCGPTSEEADRMTEEEARADFEEIRDILVELFEQEERDNAEEEADDD
jgi:hypothetical protein